MNSCAFLKCKPNRWSSVPGYAIWIAVTCMVQGCLILPTPEHRPSWWDVSDLPSTRRNVDKSIGQHIVPGQTRIEEVLLSLGEPDAVSRDGRKLAYRWEMVFGWLFIYGASPGDL